MRSCVVEIHPNIIIHLGTRRSNVIPHRRQNIPTSNQETITRRTLPTANLLPIHMHRTKYVLSLKMSRIETHSIKIEKSETTVFTVIKINYNHKNIKQTY